MLDRLLPLMAVVLLVVGFGDLARGGTTVSAVCLSAAYTVVIPAAIVRGRVPRRQRDALKLLPR